MKRILSILLCLLFILSLAACGGKKVYSIRYEGGTGDFLRDFEPITQATAGETVQMVLGSAMDCYYIVTGNGEKLNSKELETLDNLFDKLVDFEDYYSFFGIEDLRGSSVDKIFGSPRIVALSNLFNKGRMW